MFVHFFFFMLFCIVPVMTISLFPPQTDGHSVKYTTISHSTAYTAQGIAQSAHIHGKEIAFKAGSLSELVQMSYKNFERLVKPQIVKLT